MEFFKKLNIFVKKDDKDKSRNIKKKDNNSTVANKKNNTKSKNDAKIANSDNKKKNEEVSIETMQNEFDKLASQIEEFLEKFNESQNNADANLLDIIEKLYGAHNNLIKKIDSFGIEAKLQTKEFKDQNCKSTIFNDDSNLITLDKEAIKREIEKNELKEILSNFKTIKATIEGLNIKKLRDAKIKFNAWTDKTKNKKIENMKEKILASLKRLCDITYDELINCFVNIFLEKRKIQMEKQEKQRKKEEEEKRKKREEEERKKREEEEKKIKEREEKEEQIQLINLINKFLEKYPWDNDYAEATDDFCNIALGIIKKTRKFTDSLIKQYKWNAEFNNDGKLSNNSEEKLSCLYSIIPYSNDKIIQNLDDEIKSPIDKFLEIVHVDREKLNKYFKECYLRLKEIKIQKEEQEKQKLQQEKQKLQQEQKLLIDQGIPKDVIKPLQKTCSQLRTNFKSNNQISQTLKDYYKIYDKLYIYLSKVDSKKVVEKINCDLDNNDLDYMLSCLNKLKEWFKTILDKINSEDKSLKNIKKLFEFQTGWINKTSELKKLFEDLSTKVFSIAAIEEKQKKEEEEKRKKEEKQRKKEEKQRKKEEEQRKKEEERRKKEEARKMEDPKYKEEEEKQKKANAERERKIEIEREIEKEREIEEQKKEKIKRSNNFIIKIDDKEEEFKLIDYHDVLGINVFKKFIDNIEDIDCTNRTVKMKASNIRAFFYNIAREISERCAKSELWDKDEIIKRTIDINDTDIKEKIYECLFESPRKGKKILGIKYVYHDEKYYFEFKLNK